MRERLLRAVGWIVAWTVTLAFVAGIGFVIWAIFFGHHTPVGCQYYRGQPEGIPGVGGDCPDLR